MQTFGVIHVYNHNHKKDRICNSYQASTLLGHWDGPTGVQRQTHIVNIAAAVFLSRRTQLLKFRTLPIFFELL